MPAERRRDEKPDEAEGDEEHNGSLRAPPLRHRTAGKAPLKQRRIVLHPIKGVQEPHGKKYREEQPALPIAKRSRCNKHAQRHHQREESEPEQGFYIQTHGL